MSNNVSALPTPNPPAQVGNTGKQKWLHALGLTPAGEMTPEQLTAVPDGSTANPFEEASKKRSAEVRGGRCCWRRQQRVCLPAP